MSPEAKKAQTKSEAVSITEKLGVKLFNWSMERILALPPRIAEANARWEIGNALVDDVNKEKLPDSEIASQLNTNEVQIKLKILGFDKNESGIKAIFREDSVYPDEKYWLIVNKGEKSISVREVSNDGHIITEAKISDDGKVLLTLDPDLKRYQDRNANLEIIESDKFPRATAKTFQLLVNSIQENEAVYNTIDGKVDLGKQLPDIKAFDKIVELLKKDSGMGVSTSVSDFEFHFEKMRDTLDKIHLFWEQYPDLNKKIEAFEKTSVNKAIPTKERKEFRSEVNEFRELISTGIVEDINRLVNKNPDFDIMYSIGNLFRHLEEEGWLSKVNKDGALCEAIVISNENNKLVKEEIRTRTAQYVWEKMISKIPYAKINENRIDLLPKEDLLKNELIEALGVNWTETKIGVEKEKYDDYIKQMKSGRYEKIVIKRFEEFWKCSTGNNEKNLSVIEIVELGEEIWNGLYNNHALDSE